MQVPPRQNEKGRIFVVRDQEGRVTRLGISQGHDAGAMTQIDENQLAAVADLEVVNQWSQDP